MIPPRVRCTPAALRRAVAVAVAAGGLAAAGCGGPELAAPAAAPAAPPGALRLDADTIDLGPLDAGGEARATFTAHNISGGPVRLTLGGATCTCLQPELLGPPDLPAGGSVRVVLALNAKEREAGGPVDGAVALYAGRDQGVYKLTVRGFIDGFIGTVPQATYAIRGHHLRDGGPPPLRFRVCTHRADAPVRVTAVSVRRSGRGPGAGNRPGGAGPDAGEVLPSPTVQLDRMAAMGPTRDTYYQHVYEFVLPVAVRENEPPTSGVFLVDYEIANRRYVAQIPLVVVPADPDESQLIPRQMAGPGGR